ncbi:MAG: aldehyde dehydrogenase family protein [Phycisphaerales bacterium JB064]
MTTADQPSTPDAGLPAPRGGLAHPRTPLRERLAWVRRFRRAVVAGQDELIALAGEEVRKDAFETLVSDIVPLLSSCKWHERHAGRVLRTRRLRGGSVWQIGQRHWVRREPLGLVGIIATWNYPVQLLGIQLVQAIVAGNLVVVKPSERCPRTQARLLEMARDAGLDDGVLRVLGSSREAGAAMLRDEPLDHLVFTGSTAVGREIAGTLGTKLIPSTLELSGRDSAIVLADADVELAARSIGAAVRLNAGQTCMAPRRVLVDARVIDRFVGALRAEVAKNGSLVSCDGASCEARVEVCQQGEALVEGDHFGPAIAVVACESTDRMIEIHRQVGQHLATSVFTRNRSEATHLVGTLAAGTVTFNDAVIPTAHPGAPLPAKGASGWGVSRGELGLLAMTRPVHVSTTNRRVRVPTDPPTAKQAEQVKRFVRWWYGR